MASEIQVDSHEVMDAHYLVLQDHLGLASDEVLTGLHIIQKLHANIGAVKRRSYTHVCLALATACGLTVAYAAFAKSATLHPVVHLCFAGAVFLWLWQITNLWRLYTILHQQHHHLGSAPAHYLAQLVKMDVLTVPDT